VVRFRLNLVQVDFYLPKTEFIDDLYIAVLYRPELPFAADSMDSTAIPGKPILGKVPSFKVIDIGIKRKLLCDFQLVSDK